MALTGVGLESDLTAVTRTLGQVHTATTLFLAPEDQPGYQSLLTAGHVELLEMLSLVRTISWLSRGRWRAGFIAGRWRAADRLAGW